MTAGERGAVAARERRRKPLLQALYASARVDRERSTTQALEALLRKLRGRIHRTPFPAEHRHAAAVEAAELWRFAGRHADRLDGDRVLGPIAREAEDELGRLARRLGGAAGQRRPASDGGDAFVRPTFAAELSDASRQAAMAFTGQVFGTRAAKRDRAPGGRVVLRALAQDVDALAESLRPRRTIQDVIGDAALAESAREVARRIREGLQATAARPKRGTGATGANR